MQRIYITNPAIREFSAVKTLDPELLQELNSEEKFRETHENLLKALAKKSQQEKKEKDDFFLSLDLGHEYSEFKRFIQQINILNDKLKDFELKEQKEENQYYSEQLQKQHEQEEQSQAKHTEEHAKELLEKANSLKEELSSLIQQYNQLQNSIKVFTKDEREEKLKPIATTTANELLNVAIEEFNRDPTFQQLRSIIDASDNKEEINEAFKKKQQEVQENIAESFARRPLPEELFSHIPQYKEKAEEKYKAEIKLGSDEVTARIKANETVRDTNQHLGQISVAGQFLDLFRDFKSKCLLILPAQHHNLVETLPMVKLSAKSANHPKVMRALDMINNEIIHFDDKSLKAKSALKTLYNEGQQKYASLLSILDELSHEITPKAHLGIYNKSEGNKKF